MDAGEEIFEQVVNDTREQIAKLRNFHAIDDVERRKEYDETVAEIQETITDLNKSVIVMRQMGQEPVEHEDEVTSLRRELAQLLDSRQLPLEEERQAEEVDIESNTADYVHQQMMREQDTQLDQIHTTMGHLQQQARSMGDELLDQSELLQDLDTGMDGVAGKLAQGRRRLEWIYEKNKERWNDCCIVLLIIALLVLLALAVLI